MKGLCLKKIAALIIVIAILMVTYEVDNVFAANHIEDMVLYVWYNNLKCKVN